MTESMYWERYVRNAFSIETDAASPRKCFTTFTSKNKLQENIYVRNVQVGFKKEVHIDHIEECLRSFDDMIHRTINNRRCKRLPSTL
jgi:sarcosine oxidase delta subunit